VVCIPEELMKVSELIVHAEYMTNTPTPRLERLVPKSPLVLVFIVVAIELQAVCRMYLVVEFALTYSVSRAMYIIDCICTSY
jgi:hypothetical protein